MYVIFKGDGLKMNNILLVEDDCGIARHLSEFLPQKGTPLPIVPDKPTRCGFLTKKIDRKSSA